MPGTATHNREGTQNPELLPEEQWVCAPHQTPQILILAPERRAPITSSFEDQQGLHGAVVN